VARKQESLLQFVWDFELAGAISPIPRQEGFSIISVRYKNGMTGGAERQSLGGVLERLRGASVKTS
jgi:hypothetical protein